MATVSVACKLPHGIVMELPGKEPVKLAGSLHDGAVAGFGITKGVDKDFFDGWCRLYKDFVPLKRGLIFAQERSDSLRAEAAEKTAEKTGLEGLDPEKPAPGIEAENYEGKPGAKSRRSAQ